MIVIVSWVVEINLVSWAVEINLVYLREDRSDCDEFLSTLFSLVGILW